ncbi:hypothetical protein [uncultured Jannaschia sp.]|uniref:hypothetical protein n=1 Tax=uncultured Jannaschia sp. TaxID=293347 RepID=UPI00260C4C4F|nr:hypothetical protein [uncultured Jannaschia sp.]
MIVSEDAAMNMLACDAWVDSDAGEVDTPCAFVWSADELAAVAAQKSGRLKTYTSREDGVAIYSDE